MPPQEQLWSALKAGQIDMVVSDHSPCSPDLKKLDSGDFTQAWGGISSLQFGNYSLMTNIQWILNIGNIRIMGNNQNCRSSVSADAQLSCIAKDIMLQWYILMISDGNFSIWITSIAEVMVCTTKSMSCFLFFSTSRHAPAHGVF